MQIPETPGAAADLIYKLREKRLEAQKYVAALKSDEDKLKHHLLEALEAAGSTGITGKLARVRASSKDIPSAKDWDKTYEYIKETGDFSLLQRRLNSSHINELAKDGVLIPGVEFFSKATLSITKVSGS